MKRLFILILSVCLFLSLTACREYSPLNGIDSTEGIAKETTLGFQRLTWKVRSIQGRFIDDESSGSQMMIMDYETTIEAVTSIFAAQYYSSVEEWSYSSDYFEENSLFIIQHIDDLEVLDIYVDEGKLYIICEQPSGPKLGESIVTGSYFCYFIDVYDYIPASADDIIFEIRRPRA